ncbi:MAG: DUF763 domain-containing protein [Candidatus Woesearchaeota archaeon]
MKTGIAYLPLHGGSCPVWLFSKMKALCGAISEIIIEEYGLSEFLKRLSNPFFFQSLGCALGFDWHSSGITTTVCGALKEALNEKELGIKVAGGKGKTSRKTPTEVKYFSDKFNLSSSKCEDLIRASRLSAKVDNALVQDNYQLYHHTFILTEKGEWAVIQQGMNPVCGFARRYHWLSNSVTDFVEEPHSAICCQRKETNVLDITSRNSREVRKLSLDLVKDGEAIKFVDRPLNIQNLKSRLPGLLKMPANHWIKNELKMNEETLKRASDIQPSTYEELILVKGFGPRHVRALALISELIYGASASWKDPVNFSFALGGKDGTPYPVDKRIYEDTITILGEALHKAKLGQNEKLQAFARLGRAFKVELP